MRVLMLAPSGEDMVGIRREGWKIVLISGS